MKKSKGIGMIIMAVILVICVVGFFAARKYFAKKEADKVTVDKHSVKQIDVSNISKISYTYNGKTVNLEFDGSKWINADDKKADIDQSVVESKMLDSVKDIKAIEIYETPTDIAQYGFSKNSKGKIKPKNSTITLTDKNGNTTIIYVGQENPYDTSSVYLMFDKDNNVYLSAYQTIGSFMKSADELEKQTTNQPATIIDNSENK